MALETGEPDRGSQSQQGGFMTTIMPEGDAIRKAIKWVCASLQEDPKRTIANLAQEAIGRFDLSPKDADFLLRFYQDQKAGANPVQN